MKKNDSKEKFNKSVGAHLKKLRLEKELSIREVELRGEIDRSILSKIENGNRSCTLYTLKKICEAMDIEFYEFFKGLK